MAMNWLNWLGLGLSCVSVATISMNMLLMTWNVRERHRLQRLNATLLALCINAYQLRQWPVSRSLRQVLGFVVEVRPQGPEESFD